MMSNQNGSTTEEMREQIATLRKDVARMTASAAEDVKDGFGAAGRQVARSGREARDGVIDAVTANPLTAIGIAAGVGYLIGVLTRR